MRVPRQLLRETVTIEDYAGTGAHGPQYLPTRSVRASVQATTRLVVDAHGTVVNVTTAMILRPEDGPVRPESRVEARGTRYRVVNCYAMPDERRAYLYEVMLQDYAADHVGSGSGSS